MPFKKYYKQVLCNTAWLPQKEVSYKIVVQYPNQDIGFDTVKTQNWSSTQGYLKLPFTATATSLHFKILESKIQKYIKRLICHKQVELISAFLVLNSKELLKNQHQCISKVVGTTLKELPKAKSQNSLNNKISNYSIGL